jgi:hypothetical protein
MNNKLLEEYVKNIVQKTLEEQKDVQNEDLGAAFVDPIADIFKTTLYAVQDMGVRVKQTVKKVIKGLPTLFVPFLNADYEGIEKEENEELDKLKAKYEDVLQRNEAAIYGTDLAPMLFLLDPQKFLGAKLAKASPTGGLAAIRTLQVLTGGTSETINKFAERWSKFFGLDKPSEPHGPYKAGGDAYHNDTWGGMGVNGVGSWSQGNIDYGSSSSGDHGAALDEAGPAPQQNQQAMAQFQKELMAIVANPNFTQELSRSPFGQQMGKDIMNVFVGHVAKFMAAKSYDDLVRNNPQELSKVDSEVKKMLAQAKPQEIEQVKAVAFLDVKKLYKDFYVNKITQLANGKPHLAKAAQQAIAQIRAMK